MPRRMLRIVLGTLALASPGLALAEDQPVEVQIVDAMNALWGSHPGFRANHAKGVVVEGSFKASAEAAGLSRAVLFNGSAIPVTVRFSDGSGVPTVPDGAKLANPHGMSIKYHLPDGSEADMVINALHFFPVSKPEDFRDLLRAIKASPPDAPKPTKLEQFVAEHPSVPAASATAKTPESFAEEEYFGVNAFYLVDKAGKKQAVRFRMVPDKVVHLDPDEAGKRAPNYLMEELPQRLKNGPVSFHLKAQVANPGDPTNDATKEWPADRKLVDLGVLTVEKAVSDSAAAEKPLLFLPGQLPDGIEVSDDPLIDARNNAYAVSFSRRQ